MFLHFLAETATNPAPVSSGIVYILAAIAAGGGVTGLISYLRLRKTGPAEKEEIISKAAEKAVTSLESSLARLETELEQARRERDKMEALLRQAVDSRSKLEAQVEVLNERIRQLETDVGRYRSIVDHLHPEETKNLSP